MKRFKVWNWRRSSILGTLLVILNGFAFVLLMWSFWPIPRQVYSISFPDTYWSETDKQRYQFPTQRSLTMDFPAYLKLGDTNEVRAILRIGDLVNPVRREGCMDFCTLKHPGDMDIWNNYNLKAHFSNDLSNITIHPPGETIFPISLGEEQQFKWQFKAMDSGPAYLKHTVFLDYLKKMSIEGESVLIFAKELNFQVISIGSMGMPILRILCMILILSSGVWFMLERASSAGLKQVKKIENIQDLPSR